MDHSGPSATLATGARVGRYEIESFLGAGGMGRVYVARDTTLGRRVALKILSKGEDPAGIARFIREAQASSALEHPAIVSVHDAGSENGIHFLAMELIDGEPLSSWMKTRRNERKGIELMAQVADGMARAHAGGIVHRDLKPANILIARGGYAKIVDFGVAKLMDAVADPDAATELKTSPGSAVGTTAYMSPEQATGGTVDRRCDVFSFGIILHEVLGGRYPFAATNEIDRLHKIINADPPLESIPARLRGIVRRCLAKNPEERYQSMTDIAHDLRDSLSEPESAVRRRRSAPWIVLGPIVLIAAFGWIVLRTRNTGPAARELSMRRLTNSGRVVAATISPDGKFIAYTGSGLWIMQIGTGMATRISAERGFFPVLRISPDGSYVYAVRLVPPSQRAAIQRMSVLGGEWREIISSVSKLYPFTFSPDGAQLAFVRGSDDFYDDRPADLTIADAGGGHERVILRELHLQLPAWSPSGESIAFLAGGEIHEVALASGKVRSMAPAPWRTAQDLQWLPDGSGWLVCASLGEGPPQVWLAPRNGGAPRPITSDISSYYSAMPSADGRSFAAVRGEGAPSISLLSVDTNGARETASGLGSRFGFAGARNRPSNIRWIDAEHVLYEGVDGQTPTLFTIPVRGGEARQIIRGMPAQHPDVSPDGRRLAFVSGAQIWTSGVDGSGLRQLTDAPGAETPAFSGDGRYVYYSRPPEYLVWRIGVAGGRPERVGNAKGFMLDVSRDDQWLMARVFLPGRVLAQTLYRLPDAPERAVPRLPAITGRIQPRFHPSGRAITSAYRDPGSSVLNLWQHGLDGGAPRQLTHFDRGDIYGFDWSADGKSIAMVRGYPEVDVVLIQKFR